MTIRKAIMHSMNSYPEFYLIDPQVLFVESNNKAATTFTFAEMLSELNQMENEKLCVSQREYNIVKWRLNGNGRAWLRGA